jgi:transcriptional regulator with XRE-family HTH domain
MTFLVQMLGSTALESSQGQDVEDLVYRSRVGERLRSIRRQKRLSLKEVEVQSLQEFKASILGAYERGERAISVPRLQRLARFYAVPVDLLLPQDDCMPPDSILERAGLDSKIIIDLVELEKKTGEEYVMLHRYLRMIQVQRQDFNGRIISLRRDDLRAVACILDFPPEGVVDRLEELDLFYKSNSSSA